MVTSVLLVGFPRRPPPWISTVHGGGLFVPLRIEPLPSVSEDCIV